MGFLCKLGILTRQDLQVLHEEAGGHDEASAGNEQSHEECLDIFQVVQYVLLLLGGTQHDSSDKRPQLRRQTLHIRALLDDLTDHAT